MQRIISLFLLASCAAGPQGIQGSKGSNAITEISSAGAAQCPTGGDIIVTATDLNEDGVIDNGDTNIQSATICNGVQGPQGVAGATGNQGAIGAAAPETAYTPVQTVTPCGPNSSSYKEVLLVLADGSILCDFSLNLAGQDTRLTLLPDGSYIDTDESGCEFTVSTSGDTRSITWAGGGTSFQIGE